MRHRTKIPPRRVPGGRFRLPATFLAAAVLLLAASGCGGADAGAGDAAAAGGAARLPEGAPVVVVSIDTLRSDRLPVYGYDRIETPAIDRFAADSLLFEHAFTHVPLTLPAHASLFSGVLPPEHGVRDNAGYRIDASSLPWLPRDFAERGYATGAAVSAYVLRGATGMGEGFGFYEDAIDFVSWRHLGNVQRPGGETLRPTLAWLEEVHEEPFFLFFHIYEPHAPYTPPEPFASRYASAYDGEVAAADAVVGELFEALRRLGVYDEALILLTSDHGEGLGDHGDKEHGPFLYREAIQVPLLLKLPGSAQGGTRVAAPVQLVDVYPTFLELLGAEADRELPGLSLLRVAAEEAADRREGPRGLYAETYFPRLHFGWSELHSLIEWPHHYIDGPAPELYDLAADPAERHDLVAERRRVTHRLREALAAHEPRFEGPGEEDEETRAKLAALGYAGSARVGDGPLPDPKSRIHVIETLSGAYRSFGDGDYAEAERIFRRVLDDEPQMIDAWEYLGHSRSRLGRDGEALAAYEEALELSGGAPHLAYATGGALLRLGRLDEAREVTGLALPEYEAAHDLLAQIELAAGNLDAAEEHLEDALAERGTQLGPLVTEAEVALARGRHREAVELTRRAESALPEGSSRDQLRGLWFVRGSALAQLGEAAGAERAFRTEIELSPHDLPSYTHLAILYALSGRSAEAGSVLREMVETNPRPAAYAEAAQALETLGNPQGAAAVRAEGERRFTESEGVPREPRP